jgi:hypothetical protein
MLALATFISICVVAILFLLRFLFAIESEIRSARKSSPSCVKRLSIYPIPSSAGADGSVPALTLVHSDGGLALRGGAVSFKSRANDSQLKEA